MDRRTALAAALLFAFAGCTPSILGSAATERVEKTFSLEPAGAFRLENTNGAVRISQGAEGRVVVVAEKEARATDGEAARRLLEEVKVESEAAPGEVHVWTVLPRTRLSGFLSRGIALTVSYRVEVPRGTRVEVKTVNGAVEVRVPQADVRCETTNGGVEVHGAALLNATAVNGSITFDAGEVGEVTTTNGAVEGRIRSTAPRGGRVETVNGGVEIFLDPRARLRVEAENVNGGIRCELPGLRPAKHALRGDLNGGGAALVVETVNGAVALKALPAEG
ncbi:MAG: DUF4097 family beta strand repeat-containing protein [Acidobacteriota bacterium]